MACEDICADVLAIESLAMHSIQGRTVMIEVLARYVVSVLLTTGAFNAMKKAGWLRGLSVSAEAATPFLSDTPFFRKEGVPRPELNG